MTSVILQNSARSRSQIGCRRRSRPPALHSDCPPEPEDPPETGLGQRSVSLTTLQAPASIVQPRMAQLETLEAKMASIEVSLSSTPRRKKNSILGASIRSIPKELATKELETLRNALRDKENIIQSLKGQLTIPGLRLSTIRQQNNNNNNRELTDIEKKQAEERLTRLKGDVDNKRLTIKNLKMALERLDITDNIDVRIQQAELEYQLGREELNLLTLLEETRALQLCLEESRKNSGELHTLFSCVNGSGQVVLLGVEVVYDLKSPKFGASQREEAAPGLWIDWALEGTGMCKGDRLVEVNGKIVLTKTSDDLLRLLTVAPDPAQIVILRKISTKEPIVPNSPNKEVSLLRSELQTVKERAEEALKSKNGVISDNIRLTHRISYLEEQVSELLCRNSKKDSVISTVKTSKNVTNINITSPSPSPPQLFQKGPQISLIPNLEPPCRSKSSLSNVSNTHIPAPNSSIDQCHKSHRHKHRSSRTSSTQNLDKITYRKHHHHRPEPPEPNDTRTENGDLMDQSYKKATKIVHELTRDASLYEKHRQKCLTASEKYNGDILKHYNARKSTSVLDFRSEIHIGPKYSSESKSTEELDVEGKARLFRKVQESRSVKSLDFDSDCNNSVHRAPKSVDYASEPLENNRKLSHYAGYASEGVKAARPTPPKKPIRLSLHKTQSLQSVEKGDGNRKRNYKGETPLLGKNGEDYAKWAHFNNHMMRNGTIESGSWC